MAELIPSHAWSFLRGRSRDAEHALWDQYAAAAAALDGVALHNRIEVVIATALDLRAVEQLTRPLPFALHTPFNQLLWPTDVEPTAQIAAERWPLDLLATLFGPEPAPLDTHADAVVIIDGHLLPPPERQMLATRLASVPGLLVLPPNEPVPAEWRTAQLDGRLEVLPVACASPCTHAAVEEAITDRGWTALQVAGAGTRLLPAVIGLCDIQLFRHGGTRERPYAERRQACAGWISLVDGLAHFTLPHLPPQVTRVEALRVWLESWGIATADRVQHDQRFPMTGPLPGQGLRITPLLRT